MVLLLTGGAWAEADTESWSALQDEINRAAPGDTIILTGNVTAGESDAALIVPNGGRITLDLNGFTLDRNLDTFVDPAIRVASGAMLTVTDSSTASTGTITGGFGAHGGGIRNDGTLILERGRIAGNTAAGDGGGIVNYGVLVVSGGIVTGNVAGEEGGGISNDVRGSMTIDSGAVFGNSAPVDEDILNLGSMQLVGGESVELKVITSAMERISALPALALLLILVFVVRVDNYLDRKQKKALYIIAALVLTLILQNYLDNRLSLTGKGSLLRTLTSIYGYAVRPAILAMFLYLVRPSGRYAAVWALVGINAAIYLTALFSPLTFWFSANGHYWSGPLSQTCLFVSAMLFAYLFWLTIRVFHPRKRRETWIPIAVLLIIGASVALDYTTQYNDQPVSYLTIAIAVSCVFYYTWLHLQFVREHEEALRAGQRIQIMMSQIQPHFLFNTLSTIQALCAKDPPAAIYAIERFGVYLRRNIEVLQQTSLIPLEQELEHTRSYAEIEQLRFSNIRVDYDIREAHMRVPALSIQPLVENAIRHGVRGKKEGLVTVTARREGGENLIVIRDNGKGFDPGAIQRDDGAHIGIANVRSRLEQMCGGRLDIDSRAGQGSTITIHIPIAGSYRA